MFGHGEGVEMTRVDTLRSGRVQAVGKEGLRPRDASWGLVWHTKGGSWAAWVPWRHEWL